MHIFWNRILLGIIVLSMVMPVGVMAEPGEEESLKVSLDAIGTRHVGEQFTITGTTNYDVGTTLLVEIRSSSFEPTWKNETGEFSGISQTIRVMPGDPYNYWEFSVDTTSFRPDEYTVTVEAIETGVSTSGTFRVLPAEPVSTATSPETTTVPPTVLPETPLQTEPAASGVFFSLLVLTLAVLVFGRGRK